MNNPRDVRIVMHLHAWNSAFSQKALGVLMFDDERLLKIDWTFSRAGTG